MAEAGDFSYFGSDDTSDGDEIVIASSSSGSPTPIWQAPAGFDNASFVTVELTNSDAVLAYDVFVKWGTVTRLVSIPAKGFLVLWASRFATNGLAISAYTSALGVTNAVLSIYVRESRLLVDAG